MMTRADLTEAVSRALDISRKESETIVVAMLDGSVRALRSSDKVEVRWFGSLRARQRRSRIGRNPRTGERVEVPAKIPYFRPSKELLELVNSAPAAVIPPAGDRSRSLPGQYKPSTRLRRRDQRRLGANPVVFWGAAAAGFAVRLPGVHGGHGDVRRRARLRRVAVRQPR
jgi:integration host factor subunit beta